MKQKHKMELIKGAAIGGALFLLAVPALAFAPSGTKALSMGGAFTAVADDPSCVFWNPAGVTQLGGFEIDASLSASGENLENFDNFYELYEAVKNQDYEAAEEIADKEFPMPMSLESTVNLEITGAHHFAISGAARAELEVKEFKFHNGLSPYVEIEDIETALIPVYLTLASGFPKSPFKVGLNVKYIQGIRHSSHFKLLSTGKTEQINPEKTSDAQPVTSFDLGVLYTLKDSKLTYGLMMEDIFAPKLEFPEMGDSDLQSLSLTRRINLGVAFKGIPRLTLAADVHSITSNDRSFHIGGEIDLSLLKLRVGLDNGNLTYGLGLKLSFLNLEAAYSQRGKTPLISLVLLRLEI
ncbi:MAG: conjugal transfer protein TraF [Candidatus Aerophobetes bacterium]|nr:conjugal transfer protein TraF [Candidatus Aerophobetes bacterium]